MTAHYETSNDILLNEFTELARIIATKTGINLDLHISFDFINSDDSIVVYNAIMDTNDNEVYEDELILETATTWKEFISKLEQYVMQLSV